VDEHFVRKHSLPPVIYPSPQKVRDILDGSLSGSRENGLLIEDVIRRSETTAQQIDRQRDRQTDRQTTREGQLPAEVA